MVSRIDRREICSPRDDADRVGARLVHVSAGMATAAAMGRPSGGTLAVVVHAAPRTTHACRSTPLASYQKDTAKTIPAASALWLRTESLEQIIDLIEH